MKFWVYENWHAGDYAKVHKEDCGCCEYGSGCHENIRGDENNKWHGPFSFYQEAWEFARSLERAETSPCGLCKPHLG